MQKNVLATLLIAALAVCPATSVSAEPVNESAPKESGQQIFKKGVARGSLMVTASESTEPKLFYAVLRPDKELIPFINLLVISTT